MADYQMTGTNVILRTADQAWIPPDLANRDYVEYLAWVEDGGVPDPFIPPPIEEPKPTPEEQILFDHENRIRSIEGQPPLQLDNFMAHKRRL